VGKSMEVSLMKLKNIDGISQTTGTCGSWLNHWENFSGQRKPEFCPAKGCMKIDLVGAHVQKADDPDEKWYIYPLCNTHCNSKSILPLEVSDNFNLVSADKKETCGK
jgi:hypothetical protein